MPKVSALLIAPALLGAAVAGYFLADHRSATAATPAPQAEAPAAVAQAAADSPATRPLPPNHPPIAAASGASPHAAGAMPNAENQSPPSVDWKVPSGWQSVANPNPMRLATFRTAEGAEVSVARAGGQVDANITRWAQQFEGAPKPERTEKDVHGLHVTVVHLAGTYAGGMGATEPEQHQGWAMLAAIVEAPGAPYFFKVIGPAGSVDAARPSFDAFVDSIAPHAAP